MAREFMRQHVRHRYRHSQKTDRPSSDLARVARQGLSTLQRANQGYQRPLERVLFMSYGRIGRRRHDLLSQLMKPAVPQNSEAVKELLSQPILFEDGWEPPEIVLSLAKSQMHNGVLTSSRIRPALKSLHPPIPETNSWGKPMPSIRRTNIRKRWYGNLLETLLPPLPEKELQVLDGLIEGTGDWAPSRRRKSGTATSSQNAVEGLDGNHLLDFLIRGPQKDYTFREFANGRPHAITYRFMRRLWRRVSSLVPRMHHNPFSNKAYFVWDSPKVMPQLAFEIDKDVSVEDIFGPVTGSRSGQDAQPNEQSTGSSRPEVPVYVKQASGVKL
ncbi:hypothetical protein N7539_000584 [Penicillium diatomitis]|uniref:LYR motif-containing protein Cup1-like N-terminal domain-containing protein n=1 Tax=Penicillium diatomitis TaxID=2819901 RepID=A0A9W9XM13_9EURO|nr:uncharacterized protein N7539_000584 [Penicillium diatomitis]KAJ5495468.1 hypothetical protein N7539_000584 [Penicillium diatomitis]